MQEIARLKDEKSQLSEENNEALEKERRKSELSLQARDEALQAKSAAEKTLEKVRSTLRACELREERCQREKLELSKKCERLEASLSSSSDAHKTYQMNSTSQGHELEMLIKQKLASRSSRRSSMM